MEVCGFRRNKKPSPRTSGRGLSQEKRVLVVRVGFGGCRSVELAWWANPALARIRAHKPGGHVPGQMVDGVRVFGVRLGQFAGEDLRLLLEPGFLQGLDLRTARCVSRARSNAIVQRDLVWHV